MPIAQLFITEVVVFNMKLLLHDLNVEAGLYKLIEQTIYPLRMDQGVQLKLALELESCRLKTIKATGTKLWTCYCLFKIPGSYV